MTSEELKAIEQRVSQASAGPWKPVYYRNGSVKIITAEKHETISPEWYCEAYKMTPRTGHRHYLVCNCKNKRLLEYNFKTFVVGDDVEFIHHSRSDIPALCASLRKAWTLIKRDCNNCKHQIPFEDPYCNDCTGDRDKWEMED